MLHIIILSLFICLHVNAQVKKTIPKKTIVQKTIPKKTINQDSIIQLQFSAHQKDSFMVMKYAKPKPSKLMTKKEMLVIHYLNVARMYPLWFIDFAKLRAPKTANEISLVSELKSMKTIPEPLQADSLQFVSAKCHAVSSGLIGYIGHDRQGNCKSYFWGECCDYGNDDALEIVKSLLIDEGVASLGHRKICLDESYKKVGVSIQTHKSYRVNAVLDFGIK